MTERTGVIILIVGTVVVFLAAYVGLSATVVMRGWLPGLTMPDLSRLSMPEVGTTPLTAAGWAVGVLLVVVAFVTLGRAILGSPRRSHQLRAAAVSRRRPAKPPARTEALTADTDAAAGRDNTLSLPVRGDRADGASYTAGRAPLPGRGPASTSEFPAACLRGARGRAVTGSAEGSEPVTITMPRLPGADPLARQPVTAPAPVGGSGAGAAPPESGGGRGVARLPQSAWAAAGRQNLQTVRAPGDSGAQGSNGTTTAKGAGSDG